MAKFLTLQDAAVLPRGSVERDWAYSALDSMGTLEIAQNLLPRLDALQQRTYAFERAAQAPALSMMLRGVRVDVARAVEFTNELNRELKKAVKHVGTLPEIKAVWDGQQKTVGKCPKHPKGKLRGNHKWPRGVPDSPERKCEHCGAARVVPRDFEATSHPQKKKLFYGLLGVKPMRNKTGEISVDGDILVRIGRQYPKLKGVTDAILVIQDLTKQIGFMKAKKSPEGRWHSSVNVGTAWTGRWSTSKNPYGYGSNMQNITERHRRIFIADPGYTMFYADLERAESDIVAHLAGDERYIEAHKLGDPHTYVARLLWPELAWTGDLKKDKAVAKALPDWDPVPGHDFRFQAKRVQHGGNYGLTPFGISMIAKIPLAQAKRAYYAYHDEFPGIRGWQDRTRKLVVNQETLINPLGREIVLFGRPWDEHTYKQGLSFVPQSTVADLIAIAIWRMWKHYRHLLELQMQIHDAVLGQFLTSNREEAVKALQDAISIPFDVTDIHGVVRRMKIGVEVMLGQNFGKFNDQQFNADGTLNPTHNPRGMQ